MHFSVGELLSRGPYVSFDSFLKMATGESCQLVSGGDYPCHFHSKYDGNVEPSNIIVLLALGI